MSDRKTVFELYYKSFGTVKLLNPALLEKL